MPPESPPPAADLDAFIAEAPIDRPRILTFVKRVAEGTPPGARLLDAGAGAMPYRELFAHCDYVTADWEGSLHANSRGWDIVAPLHDLPVEDTSFDAVLSTQVLEHIADPAGALAELHRVLVPDGRLWVTVPFVGELHEEPYDFFRYTSHGLRELVERAGFDRVEVEPLGGYFSAMGALAYSCGVSIGVTRDRSDLGRRVIAAAGRMVGKALPRLDQYDRRRALPLGYACRARRPAAS